jgi:hypothetical protein
MFQALKNEMQRQVGGLFVETVLLDPRNFRLVFSVVERLPAPLRAAQIKFFRVMINYDRANFDRITGPQGGILRRKGKVV